jgi:hypothetical protein
VIESNTASTAALASFFDSPLAEATLATRSFLFTLEPPLEIGIDVIARSGWLHPERVGV